MKLSSLESFVSKIRKWKVKCVGQLCTKYLQHVGLVKGPFSDLGQFLTTGSPLKLMKNAFNFMIKALFVLEIFTFLN